MDLKANNDIKEFDDKALEILNKYFGYNSFRPGQKEIIDEILKGNDTVAIMPTGGGKSICYQVPAMIIEGLTIVVSPLISLMKDQVDAIRDIGIESAYINSTLSNKEIDEIFETALSGKLKILYVAPERLETSQFLNLVSTIEVGFVAIDEAHCVSQWGHDFRTSYRFIKSFINILNKRPIVAAFTATATSEVREDIAKLLGLQQPKVFISGFDRENIKINIIKGANKKHFILDFIKENLESAGIIYAATRKEVDSIHEYLSSKNISCTRYHAGLSDDERSRNQEDFVYDRYNVMIATNAFGMGIDKPNIRYVIHYNMPKNIEGYYQEIGRAGRDGEESQAILLFSPGDIHTQKYIIDIGTGNEIRKVNEYKKLQNMTDLVYSNDCYRKYILNYFGEEYDKKCNKCSNCEVEGELTNKTLDAQKVLSCVYRMKRPYGVTVLIDTLRGSENKKIKDIGFHKLSTYGIMKDYSKDDLKNFINTLVSHRILAYDEGEYPVVRLNERSMSVLRGEEEVWFKEIQKAKKIVEDNSLFEILRNLRREIAVEEKVPPYIVFGDATLKEMSSRFPKNLEQLGDISGVGELKLNKYGERFVNTIASYLEENQLEVSFEYKKKEKSVRSTSASRESDETHSEKLMKQKENSSNKEVKKKSYMITIEMLRDKLSLLSIAKEREITISTICSHLEQYVLEGNEIDFQIDFTDVLSVDRENLILEAVKEVGDEKLKPIKEKIDGEISYDEIKVALLKNRLIV
ncbi:DNA helicase RecQ [Clostridium manihotivorum]|uniref:DNA helicase RecQ n=1 Tax=Clostridium manihotivorum TaxID=2320868 RepID=A0A410DRC7_9CLOT|nr:DNA helicase RecQ [Clostridium manihotivorum]QAA31597.1 DNA helicase RecQ [Clostridium manihotivorum]